MSSQVTINDIIPRTQAIASNLQTVFNTNWTANATSDIQVYARADGVEADDATQLVSSNDYVVTFIGGTETVRVTFNSGRTTGDIITIVRNTPADRENLYTNTNFSASMLNQDFGILTLVDQQAQMFDEEITPRYNKSEILTPIVDTILPKLGANQIWAKNNANAAFIAYDVPASGGVAPKLAKYLVQVATSELPNAQSMGALPSGIVVNTTTTGVQLTREIVGATDQIDLSNGTGISGNPMVSIATNPILPGTGSFIPPKGTTAQRSGTPVSGMTRYNTDLLALEFYNGTSWDPVSGGVVDSIAGTTNQITIDSTNPAVPIVSIASNPILPGTGGETLPTGTTAQRAGGAGTMRFNSQTSEFEGTTDGATWNAFQTSAGTILSVSGTANQIDVTAGVNPVVSLSSTINAPGTFNIQSTTAINAIINDSTLATATTTNIATAAALKTYIDSLVTGLNIQGSCVCASTTALTVTYANGTAGVGATLTNAGVQAAISLDGVSPTVGQRVLIKNQASSLQNGIYTVTTVGSGATNWVLTRATDYDTPSEVQPGDLVVLTGGTTQSQSSWLETATVTTIGTDPITFVQFTASLPVNVASGGTGNTTFTPYSVICAGTTATGSFQNVSGVGTANQVLVSNGASALPSWQSVPGLTPAALTRTDDTNVTLTLGGTPTTALLQATSLTLGWTGQLGLTRGGTAASLTASNGGIVYSTASALAILAGTATAGQILRSGASTTPSWSTATYPATAGASGNYLVSDGTNWLSTASTSITSVATQTFTSTGAGTYTPTSGMKYCIIELQGAGGGSGGTTGAAGSVATSGGGGSGGYLRILATAAQIGASAAIAVGAGGTAGAAGVNGGGSGGATTITISGSVWSPGAGGGGAGKASSATAQQSGDVGSAGVNSSGTNATQIISSNGEGGKLGMSSYTVGVYGINSDGGESYFSGSYGRGGIGVYNATAVNQAGLAGAQGVIVITEFI